MAVLITCKSVEDSIKTGIPIVRTTFSEVYGALKCGNSHANSRNWLKIEFVRDFLPVLVICKFDEDSIKNEVNIVRTTFSPLYVYGTFWLPWKPKFCPKHNTDNPTPMTVPVKFDQNWPTGLGDILVRKCGRTHGRRGLALL